jgi:hypothetical protein
MESGSFTGVFNGIRNILLVLAVLVIVIVFGAAFYCGRITAG